MARKPAIVAAKPARYTTMRAAAESLTRRNADAAVCELFNEALARVIDLAFETDDGGLCNVDYVTGKLLFPQPWGRLGHKRWGLRPSEANTLRVVLYGWLWDGLPLLLYDKARKAWHVNLLDYPDRAAAAPWLAAHQVTIPVYRAARDKVLGGE